MSGDSDRERPKGRHDDTPTRAGGAASADDDDDTAAVSPLAGARPNAVGGSRAGEPRVPQPGEKVGRFIVLDQAGRGGMCTVCIAYDPQLDRRVAVKLLHGKDTGESRLRLLREAQAMARLPHPHIVPVHEVGTSRGEVFIAMEYVDGANVADWVRTEKPSTREVLRVFRDAGAALAAAHAAGLVHRDVKPSNMLIDRNGRVQVTDFGLVMLADAAERPRAAASVSEPLESSALESPLTRDGSILGTPVFMAPEQFEGYADARSDQFSFCVSLYWALYGELPFDSRHADGLPAPRPAPPSSTVPRFVRRVLLRGLSARPEDRYPTMDALLADVARDPGARWRRLALAAGMLALAGGGVVGASAYTVRRAHRLCGGAEEALASVWNAQTTEVMHTAFAKTGKSWAASSFERVRNAIDDYTHAWVQMHRRACEATRLRGEQSEELLDLRMQCLRDREQSLATLLEIMLNADERLVERGAEAIQQLPSIEQCANVTALRAPLAPAPSQRAEVEALRRVLASMEAELAAGRFDAATARLQRAQARIDGLGYLPLRAMSAFLHSRVADVGGDEKAAETTCREAIVLAIEGRDDRLVARALSTLVFYVGKGQGRLDDAVEISRNALAWLHRIGGDIELEATLHANLGSVYESVQKLDDARAQFEQALALDVKRLGSQHPYVAQDLNGLAMIFGDLSRYDEALALNLRALAIQETQLGPAHPNIAPTLIYAAIHEKELGRFDEASRSLDRAEAIMKASLPASHPYFGYLWQNRSEILERQGQIAPALAAQEKALALLEAAMGSDHPDVAGSYLGLASLQAKRGRAGEALALYRRALGLFEKASVEMSGDVGRALVGIGQTLVTLGRAREALPPLERAVQLSGAPVTVRAGARFALARALVANERDHARALDLAIEARALLATLSHAPRELADVERWLAQNGARR